MSETLPEFALPTFSESSHGWGPSESSLPQHLVGLPFLPFDKSEKLTRISDWNNPRDRDNQGGNRRTVDEEEIGGDDEGGAFSLVDNKVKAKPRFGAFRPYQQRRPQQQQQNAGQFKGNRQQQSGNQNQNAQRNQQSGNASKPSQGGQSWNALAAGGSGWTQAGKNIRAGAISNINPGRANAANARGGQQNFRQNQRRWGFEAKEKEPSVPIRDDFKLVSDIELSELSGVTFEPTDSEELLMAGELKPFKAEFNRITPRTATTLARFEQRQFFTASTTEDPILNKMISEKQGNVFATDAILSLLMSASRSVYSWDLLLHKRNGQLIFDKRPDSKIDFLSVNENAADSLNEEEEDSINHPSSLAVEATLINHNFSQQCLNAAGEKIEYDEPNPFLSSLAPGSEPAQVAYRYQQFSMGPNVNLVARASVNAYTQKTGADPSLVLTRVLNEFDPRLSGSTVEWRQKLESQTGAILAVEMKNNSFKLARFLSEAVVAGVDEVKLGFVSRFNTKSNTKHQILMAKHYTPTNLAESVNIRIKTLWGSLKVLIDKLQNLPDGEYLVLRDANKPTIHVYEVPADAFQGQSNAGDM